MRVMGVPAFAEQTEAFSVPKVDEGARLLGPRDYTHTYVGYTNR